MEDGPTERPAEGLDAQVELLLSSDALGRSPALERLLRYLAAQARQGHVPKEVEIADAVFTRSSGRDPDSSVRVYLHRLRRKLDEFYAGPGGEQPYRVSLPKGAYRLTVTPAMAMGGDIDAGQEQPKKVRRLHWLGIVAAAGLVALVAGWLGYTIGRADDPIVATRASALWRPLINNERNLGLVVGDYYIFGESDEMGEIIRLIRDFNVQSPEDLDMLRSGDTVGAARYTNLDLTYLPIGVADALRTVVPVLTGGGTTRRQVLTVPASQMNARLVSENDLVYLGYISGLHGLRFPVFSPSRFAVGGSYDEIVDRKTGKHYVADSHLAALNRPGEDYAIVSAFKGPTGNRILVIAGTRDAALMQAARFVSNPDTVRALDAVAGQGSFEALISIDALNDLGLRARILVAAPRPDPIWNKPANLVFPDTMP